MDIDQLWDFDNPAATEDRFRNELLIAPQADRAELGTQIARTFSLRREFDQAIEELGSARTDLDDEPSRAHVRLALELGRTYNSSGKKAEASLLFELARVLARATDEEGLEVDAVHMLAISDADRALEWNEAALKLARQYTDPKARKWQGSLLNNLGWTYFKNGELERAHSYFEEALAVRQSEGSERQIHIAKWCVGRSYRALGRHQEARELMESLYDPDKQDGFVSEELAILYADQGESENAAFQADRALSVLTQDSWFVENEPERVSLLRQLVSARQDA